MAGGKASSQQAVLVERRQKAFELRKAGQSYRSIARTISTSKKFGTPKYNESQAYKDVSGILKELVEKTTHDAEEYRQIELERLDTAIAAIEKKVKSGDLFAVDRWIKLSESRRKLLGLDAPVQIEVQERVDAELNTFLTSLESLLPPETFKQVLSAVAAVSDRATMAATN